MQTYPVELSDIAVGTVHQMRLLALVTDISINVSNDVWVGSKRITATFDTNARMYQSNSFRSRWEID